MMNSVGSDCLRHIFSHRQFIKQISKRSKAYSKPTLDVARFQRAVSQLPPRFSNEELGNVITLQEDPLVCLELFNWASQQPRFRHNVSTYHIMIKKLGAAETYQEMDDVVNQVLAVPYVGSETLYNTIIYFFAEARKLTRAVKSSRNLECGPLIRKRGRVEEAMKLLKELQDKDLVDGHTYRKLQHVFEDDLDDSNNRKRFQIIESA
ncbi:hypothetical protein Q3G72_021707 [Acer saccharum]|nr:hypothetical protein Q3G72_021707 [Acer saccharum]